MLNAFGYLSCFKLCYLGLQISSKFKFVLLSMYYYNIVLFVIVGVYDSHVILSCYYRKITEQNCSQVVTHYGGNKFGGLFDVAIAPIGEVVAVDSDNKYIIMLDDKLNLLKLIGNESGDSRLVDPNNVAVTDNVIAVSDWGSHQVKNIPYKESSYQ